MLKKGSEVPGKKVVDRNIPGLYIVGTHETEFVHIESQDQCLGMVADGRLCPTRCLRQVLAEPTQGLIRKPFLNTGKGFFMTGFSILP